MVKCKICRRVFDNFKGLSSHLRQKHKIKSKEYYDKFIKREYEGLCPECGNKTNFNNLKNGYLKFCSVRCAHTNEEVLEQIAKTCEERYGGLGLSSPILKERIENTNVKKYGVKNNYTRQDIKAKSHSSESLEKVRKTKERNKTFNTSKPERKLELRLRQLFPDLKVQYKSDVYPFACDFYIPSLDLYIECNLHWTHGGRFFDKNNKNDVKLLAKWQGKAKTSKFYAKAIETWSIRDILKLETAVKNNLNYIAWFNEEQANDWIRSIENEQNNM